MSYMNKILENWHNAGFKTKEDVDVGDTKPSTVAKSEKADFDSDDYFASAIKRTKNKKREQADE